jgi:hypothetical protein
MYNIDHLEPMPMFSKKRKLTQDSFWKEKKSTLHEIIPKKEYKIYYHATALPNANSILKQGLCVNQRGLNEYRLDLDGDVENYYGSADVAKEYKKPPCIHLTTSIKNAEDYMGMIQDFYNKGAVLFKIRLEASVELKPDSESAQGKLCLSDIQPKFIKMIRKIEAPAIQQTNSQKNQNESSDEEYDTEENERNEFTVIRLSKW